MHRGLTEYEDLMQANTEPSTNTPRGHMTPAAFMIMASGLDDVSCSFCPYSFHRFIIFREVYDLYNFGKKPIIFIYIRNFIDNIIFNNASLVQAEAFI